MGEEAETDSVLKKPNLFLKVRWCLEGFLWNSKEEESDSNENKMSLGVEDGGGNVDESWESQLRNSFDFFSKTLDAFLIIYSTSLQNENSEQFDIFEEWDESL